MGLEHLTLTAMAGGVLARSSLVGDRGGLPYGMHYEIGLTSDWRVTSFAISATDGRHLAMASPEPGLWVDAVGKRQRQFDGCLDIDLAGTPFTNTLPIRRLSPEADSRSGPLRMLYVPFDTLAPRIDTQRYSCIQPWAIYRYEAVDRSFVADLNVDRSGVVVDYPGLFERC